MKCAFSAGWRYVDGAASIMQESEWVFSGP